MFFSQARNKHGAGSVGGEWKHISNTNPLCLTFSLHWILSFCPTVVTHILVFDERKFFSEVFFGRYQKSPHSRPSKFIFDVSPQFSGELQCLKKGNWEQQKKVIPLKRFWGWAIFRFKIIYLFFFCRENLPKNFKISNWLQIFNDGNLNIPSGSS